MLEVFKLPTGALAGNTVEFTAKAEEAKTIIFAESEELPSREAAEARTVVTLKGREGHDAPSLLCTSR